MPKPHATVDHDRRVILGHIAAAILNLGQAQKDLTECEPETLNQFKRDSLKSVALRISKLATELLKETPGT